MVGISGGAVFLAGLVLTLVGHRHKGESPVEFGSGFKRIIVPPFVLFLIGLVMMGAGLVLGIYALVNGLDNGNMTYNDFLQNPSE